MSPKNLPLLRRGPVIEDDHAGEEVVIIIGRALADLRRSDPDDGGGISDPPRDRRRCRQGTRRLHHVEGDRDDRLPSMRRSAETSAAGFCVSRTASASAMNSRADAIRSRARWLPSTASRRRNMTTRTSTTINGISKARIGSIMASQIRFARRVLRCCNRFSVSRKTLAAVAAHESSTSSTGTSV